MRDDHGMAAPLRPSERPSDAPATAPLPPSETAVRQRRWPRLAAGAIILALLAGGVAACSGYHGQAGEGTGGAPQGDTSSSAGAGAPSAGPGQTRDAVQALLDERAGALERQDRAAFLAPVDPAATRFRRDQARMFDALRDVPVEGWSYELAATSPFRLSSTRQQELGPAAFTAKVVASYRLEGYDHASTEFDLYYTFKFHDGRWLVAGDSDGDEAGYHTQRQVWDFGTVTVVRGEHSIVLGLDRAGTLERYAKEADQAVPRVTKVWGSGWEQTVVVIAPDTQAQMATLLGAPPRKYAQIAAVTRAESAPPSERRLADRIVINPAVWAKLTTAGRRIVMTHEVTHVATRTATNAGTPPWLSEGFADYIGYLGTGVRVDVAARELLRDIRSDGPPRALPTDQDFATNSDDLAAAYEQAWLACRLIAATYGEDKLVTFYREVGVAGGTRKANLATAFHTVLQTTTARFTTFWRDYLADLADQ